MNLNPLRSKSSNKILSLMDAFLSLTIIILLGLGILMLFINDPQDRDQDDTVEPIGSMMVEMFWPDDVHVDMDLWVQAPDDSPVGFSRKTGIQFDLLRDDLGRNNDMAGRNYEIMIGKDIVPGKYYVNVDWYPTGASNRREGYGPGIGTVHTEPIEVRVVVSLTIKGQIAKQIIARTYTVKHLQEINMFNFEITEEYDINPDSVYSSDRVKLSSGGGIMEDDL